MEYGMLTTLIPEAYDEEFRQICRHTMQDAANVLQQNLYEGLCAELGHTIPVFNILPVSSFPQYCSRAFFRRKPLGDGGVDIGFCNVKLLRNRSRSQGIYRELKRWCASSNEPKTLLMYTISQSFVLAVWKLKKKYPDLRVCAIVADLPDMCNLSSSQSFGARLIAKLRSRDAYSMLSCVDRFVLLTKHMASYMGLTQPWCVMEGIAAGAEALPERTDDGTKTVMYSGTLHRQFGVMRLVEAFRKIEDPRMRLVLCGIGDSEGDIRRAAEEDGRIDFLGQLKRDEVIRLQRQATVLVNPRPGDEEFTKYSFPSKTMEYLASGVPVVAYKLAGIEDEYDAYLQYPRDGSVEALADKLCQVCSWPRERWAAVGREGRRFVLENKNAVAQARRILEFLSDEKVR